jgi:hypothetical protein
MVDRPCDAPSLPLWLWERPSGVPRLNYRDGRAEPLLTARNRGVSADEGAIDSINRLRSIIRTYELGGPPI